MTVLIGISGPIAAGKSTLAQGLKRIFELKYHSVGIISFASGLKYLASFHNDPDAEQIAYHYFKSLGIHDDAASGAARELMLAFTMFPVVEGVKPRQLLQYIGTEIGRDYLYEDIWIDAVKQQAKRDYPYAHFIISDDLRFVNESNAVDFHVAITMNTPSGKAAYQARKTLYPADYFFSNHQSEQKRDLLRTPDFTIETDFSVNAVVDLAEKLIAAKYTLEYGTPNLSYKDAMKLDKSHLEEYFSDFNDWNKYPYGRYQRLVTSGSIPADINFNRIYDTAIARFKFGGSEE